MFRAKRRYSEERPDEVLRHRNQVNRYRKLDDRGEAHLIALACSPAPEGDHWTLRLLAGKAVELGLEVGARDRPHELLNPPTRPYPPLTTATSVDDTRIQLLLMPPGPLPTQ